MTVSTESLDSLRSAVDTARSQLNATVVGQAGVIELLLVATLARGHVLLEGDVGVGKTTVLRALGTAVGGAFERVEGTIDLAPADLLYHTYVAEDGKPRVEPGPLLRHGDALSVFFFNEINRARPQVHSLMLRAMAERSAQAFNREYRFPHLQVFADRNRVEREETFELPAAARDRFLMEIEVRAPQQREEQRTLLSDPRFHDVDALIETNITARLDHAALNAASAHIQREVRTTETLENYLLDLCAATCRPADFGVDIEGVDMEALVLSGVSPRGASMLARASRVVAWLAGRGAVVPEDVHLIFEPVVAHRVFFTPVYELRRSQLAGALMRGILEQVGAPRA